MNMRQLRRSKYKRRARWIRLRLVSVRYFDNMRRPARSSMYKFVFPGDKLHFADSSGEPINTWGFLE